jgi:hypothetical protein
MAASPIRLRPVSELKLDTQNPRLPESKQGASQSEILRHLFEHDALDELAQSYVDNGFFPHEPVIVLNKPESDGRSPVLEGNRRLATLMILLGSPEAEELSFAGIELPAARQSELQRIPCYHIDTREEVHAYLGFRHIGGIKTWEPEAKARYLLAEIDRTYRQGSVDPFRDVGRRVGSNALGVRNPYIAIRILKHARDEFGLEINHVQHERFGVWLRAMNSPDIRRYIGLGDPRSYGEVEGALKQLTKRRLKEVLADFSPRPGKLKPILADSRDVTNYGRVLADEGARAVLRQVGDLALAIQLLARADLPTRIAKLTAACKLLLDEFHGSELDDAAIKAVEELYGVVRTMRAVAKQGPDD